MTIAQRGGSIGSPINPAPCEPLRYMSVRGKNKMTVEDHYKEKYEASDTPWDIGKPDFNLIQTVTTMAIEPCKALDIGCGTGDNSIWLSQNNFHVIGIDTSEIEIEKAIEKASKANVKCTFIVIDFLTNKIEGAPFGFAFDRGCFHSLNSDEERKRFAENVIAHLEKGLNNTGFADVLPKQDGPGNSDLLSIKLFDKRAKRLLIKRGGREGGGGRRGDGETGRHVLVSQSPCLLVPQSPPPPISNP